MIIPNNYNTFKIAIICVFLFLVGGILFGQEYKSKTTAYAKQDFELEFIDRSIKFTLDQIIITSIGRDHTDVQILTINYTEEKEFGNFGTCTWFYCTTKNLPGSEKVVILPKTQPIKQINIFEPILNGVTSKNVKILIGD